MSQLYNLNIREFDLSQIKMKIGHTPRILVYGPSGSGKSSLIIDLLYHNQDVPIVTVVSPTERFNHTFKDIVPDIFLHDFNKEVIKKYTQRQENIQEKYAEDPEYKNVDPRSILILDDCLHKIKNIRNDPEMDFLFIAGRHVSACPIFAIQDPIGLSPTQRGQLSYAFIFYEDKHTNLKKLYEHYCGIFPDQKTFNEVLDYVTQDYGCLVIDYTNKKTRNLEDKIFWYRAKLRSNFKMCDDMFWNIKPIDSISESKLTDDGRNHYLNIRRIRSYSNEEEEYNPNIKPIRR